MSPLEYNSFKELVETVHNYFKNIENNKLSLQLTHKKTKNKKSKFKYISYG